jgi:radical SAM-linked protein
LGTIPVTARLPWDHFDIGLEDGFLAREYRKALASRLSPPCGKVKGMFIHHTNVPEARSDERKLVCYDCGIACDMSQMREERITFLEQLGATETPEPKADDKIRLPLLNDAAEAPMPTVVKAQFNPESLRPVREGKPERWRFRFEKKGPTALLGHLDLLRELPRVIRRAGLRIHYTTGYNPHPDLSFGPALSLGVVSLDEYVDVKLLSPPADRDAVLASLRAASADGLYFLDARPLGDQESRVNVGISGATYLLAVSRKVVQELSADGSMEPLETAIAGFLQAPSTKVMRRIKGIGKVVDVREYVEELAIEDEHQATLTHAGLIGDLIPIRAKVRILPTGAVKSSEIVEAICQHLAQTLAEPLPHRAVRLALHAGDSSPMQKAARSDSLPASNVG